MLLTSTSSGSPPRRVAALLLLVLSLAVVALPHAQSSWTPIGFDQYWPDSVRLLEQATFGATSELVEQLNQLGAEAFLDQQFAAPLTAYPDLPPMPSNRPADCTGDCQRQHYTMYPLQRHFFSNALNGEDQLRQRVAFALGQIFVVSNQSSNIRLASWMAPYQQLLYANAFGNFRQLLKDVTLNAAMGSYLNMLNNKKLNPATGVKPNENYAREVLQLFSVGLVRLNDDGTALLDEAGQPIAAYDQATVEEIARVITGWVLAPAFGTGVPNYRDPMVVRIVRGVEVDHDSGAKRLLDGAEVPAGLSAAADLDVLIDNIFNHPNVGPFIGKQLIQHLVTSNPSPAYVARVAAVFAANSAGQRGDLREVVRAILLDDEARGTHDEPSYGHLREPVLFITSLLRAFHATSDGVVSTYTASMGQDLFRAASVFNYYPPGYRVPGTNGLLGPEFRLHDSATALARLNFVNTIVFGSIAANQTDRPLGTKIDLAPLTTLSAGALVDELDGLLLGGSMPAAMRDTILAAVQAVPSSNTAANALLRARTAAYLVATSALFQVQR